MWIRPCHLLICLSLASAFAPPRLAGAGARSGGVAPSAGAGDDFFKSYKWAPPSSGGVARWLSAEPDAAPAEAPAPAAPAPAPAPKRRKRKGFCDSSSDEDFA